MHFSPRLEFQLLGGKRSWAAGKEGSTNPGFALCTNSDAHSLLRFLGGIAEIDAESEKVLELILASGMSGEL